MPSYLLSWTSWPLRYLQEHKVQVTCLSLKFLIFTQTLLHIEKQMKQEFLISRLLAE